MDRWQNRVAVVTGASSGIGSAIVKDLVQAGFIVAGLARRKERIDEFRQELSAEDQDRLHAVLCDVSNWESVTEAFDWIEEKLGAIDVLINNAGTFAFGQLVTMDVNEIQRVLQTNLMGVIYCTQRAFKSMKERNFDGHIIIMNSVMGHKIFPSGPGVVPHFNIYPPTKYALTAVTEILRQELISLGTKIKITSISPGLVDTKMVVDEYRDMNMLKPEEVSAAVLYTISTPPTVQLHELTIKPVGEIF